MPERHGARVHLQQSEPLRLRVHLHVLDEGARQRQLHARRHDGELLEGRALDRPEALDAGEHDVDDGCRHRTIRVGGHQLGTKNGLPWVSRNSGAEVAAVPPASRATAARESRAGATRRTEPPPSPPSTRCSDGPTSLSR